MPPQDQEVLFSLSLPLVVTILLLLGLVAAAAAWLLACHRRPAAPPLTPASIPWLPALLELLPCGALLTGAQGRVRLANGQAGRAATGTGLGLTILRTILAQHGAEIRVQSEPELGTTFSFDLPIAAQGA